MKKLSSEDEEKVLQKVKALAEQDDSITLPPSLQSSHLLAKLNEQPALVSMDNGVLTRRRSVYIISTCAAAFLLLFGLSRFLPALGVSQNFAQGAASAGVSSASAIPADDLELLTDKYQQVVQTLQILSDFPQERYAASAKDAADEATSDSEEAVPASEEESNVLQVSPETAMIDDVPENPTEEETETAVTEQSITPESDALDSEPNTLESSILASEQTSVTEPSENASANTAPFAVSGGNGQGNLVVQQYGGEWVYWLEQKEENDILHLFNAQTMEEDASILLPQNQSVSELFSYANLLVCVDSSSFAQGESHSNQAQDQPGVTAYLYQLDDNYTASLLNTISISGVFQQSYLSADGVLYLTANQWVDASVVEASSDGITDEDTVFQLLPSQYNAQLQKEAAPIPAENISVIDDPVEPNYLNVVSIDLANGGAVGSWSFLGREGTISLSGNVMSMITSDGSGGTQLISFDFSDNTVKYRISKSVSDPDAAN